MRLFLLIIGLIFANFSNAAAEEDREDKRCVFTISSSKPLKGQAACLMRNDSGGLVRGCRTKLPKPSKIFYEISPMGNASPIEYQYRVIRHVPVEKRCLIVGIRVLFGERHEDYMFW